MRKFTTLTAVAAPLLEANISTDAIIPSVWAITAGIDLGAKLFAHQRYDPEGRPDPDFILNIAPYDGAGILVAGPNFGCGSSREAAVWALDRFGIRCVIAPSFAEIFEENCVKNGVLPARLDRAGIDRLAAGLERSASKSLTVDLSRCEIATADGSKVSFQIASSRRNALLLGLDDAEIIRRARPAITAFEKTQSECNPWLQIARGAAG
jgi:3-isopropylmalate/(R)-2-methylmalate dehydratase small subunit